MADAQAEAETEGNEFRVAVLGTLGAGTTTVINGLLHGEYGEVSERGRTTAGVYSFRIGTSDDNSEFPQTAESILKEISDQNKRLLKRNDLQERIYDVDVSDCSHELYGHGLRTDHKVVLVDIPCVYDAGVTNKFWAYVNENWIKFDCAVVVIDVKQRVKKESLQLIRFVKTNLMSKKYIPLVIVCNKVDDPEDEDVKSMVEESQERIEQILRLPSQPEGSHELNRRVEFDPAFFPAFVPISAKRAFIYGTFANMTISQLRRFDKDLNPLFGRGQTGVKPWQRLSQREQFKRDRSHCRDGFLASNFPQLVQELAYCVRQANTLRCLSKSKRELAMSREEAEDLQIKIMELTEPRIEHTESFDHGLDSLASPQRRLCLAELENSRLRKLLAEKERVMDSLRTEIKSSLKQGPRFEIKTAAIARQEQGKVAPPVSVSPLSPPPIPRLWSSEEESTTLVNLLEETEKGVEMSLEEQPEATGDAYGSPRAIEAFRGQDLLMDRKMLERKLVHAVEAKVEGFFRSQEAKRQASLKENAELVEALRQRDRLQGKFMQSIEERENQIRELLVLVQERETEVEWLETKVRDLVNEKGAWLEEKERLKSHLTESIDERKKLDQLVAHLKDREDLVTTMERQFIESLAEMKDIIEALEEKEKLAMAKEKNLRESLAAKENLILSLEQLVEESQEGKENMKSQHEGRDGVL